MSIPSIPGIPDIIGIPDMPEEVVLMTPDTIEVGCIAMVMEPMESIVNSLSPEVKSRIVGGRSYEFALCNGAGHHRKRWVYKCNEE